MRGASISWIKSTARYSAKTMIGNNAMRCQRVAATAIANADQPTAADKSRSVQYMAREGRNHAAGIAWIASSIARDVRADSNAGSGNTERVDRTTARTITTLRTGRHRELFQAFLPI